MTTKRPNKEKKLQQKILAEKVRLLNYNLLVSIPANFICFLIVFIGLYPHVNHTTLFTWFLTVVLTFIVHGGGFFVNRIQSFPKTSYLKFLIGLAITYGVLWGIVGSILIPENNLLSQMLVMMVVLGVTSGGLHTLQPSMTASTSFFLLMLLPIITWIFLQNALTYTLLGIASIFYLCFILVISWMGNNLLNTNYLLHYETMDLVERLAISNNIMKESESRFRSAFDFAAIGMALVSLEGKWLKVNPSLCQLLGYSEEELLKTDFQTITYPEDLALDLSYARQLLAGNISSYNLEKRYIKKDGTVLWILLSGSLIRNAQNNPLYFIAQIQDIDAQKKAEQELKYMAYHDALTGLSNRKQLDASFDLVLSFAKRQQNQIAILFMDLDHFKDVNDTLGHDIGDLLLMEIGARLKTTIRSTDFLIRQGGDEFIIVLTELHNSNEVVEIAQKILTIIATPLEIKSHPILITGSIGISLYPQNGQDLKTLIKQADKALYLAKAEGRNNFRFA